jgi:20S proteasome alpha/beta subunit
VLFTNVWIDIALTLVFLLFRLNDYMWDDGNNLGPRDIHNYLTRIMYNKRNNFDPFWNTIVLGGVKNGEKYLGVVCPTLVWGY